MASRDRTPQPRDAGSTSNGRRPPPHPDPDALLLNVHSRTSIRERLRLRQQQQQQQQGAGGVLADLNTLHTQQNKDFHTLFAPTPRDSIPASVYVSGHLSPSDQWVAVGNESSGVISLTESDAEDDAVPDLKGRGPLPHVRADSGGGYDIPADPQYRLHTAANNSRADNAGSISHSAGDDADHQAVHLLRESVASLLSAANSPSSSSVSSAQPYIVGSGSRRQHNQLQPSVSTGGRPPRTASYARSQSPSDLSKISEPCYLSSAPNRHVTADIDHFSDVVLSSYAATAPPTQQRQAARPSTQLPTYQEFKQQRHDRQTLPVAVPSGASSAAPTRSAVDPPRQPYVTTSAAEASTAVNSAAYAYHPLLADYGIHRRPAGQASISSNASRSPFASIRTVSPIIMDERHQALDSDLVSQAQAEAALEQTILCPMSQTISEKTAETDAAAASGDRSGSVARQNWARYTGYAIVGFGVGTLVGMMCFDMAASSTPKATRTIPIASV
ncbi:hypothetical protein IWW55_002283 [Coemansia sp. RSA 2706]|nr:hypothetical protein IWW55_002283 [Coemansia sp. RSA 2706]KAJ2317873.1 hypothetical protein IWW52_002884 [Coemansia sp. RSA 2704]KAJ2326933.1 hypothetical protein IWW51_002022 [Coemansia sp. RSA 2702]KAJ2392100.1 hypothetical protein H4S02_000970 [Coemansia sp. RSA 2611]KAJ2730973.1 hypothetical protein H4R23_003189 [Coemansia sp. Cherry 401B]